MSKRLQQTRAILVLLSLGTGGLVAASSACAQYGGYVCPPGYIYDPYYGCVPVGYLNTPPYYYAFPDFGFDFLYGGEWGRRWAGHPPPRGPDFHGPPPTGPAFRAPSPHGAPGRLR
jgi:hypothetical protein